MKPLENIVGKAENGGNQHFLIFPQYFLPFPKQILIFESHLFFLSANPLNLDKSNKNKSFGDELTGQQDLSLVQIESFNKHIFKEAPPVEFLSEAIENARKGQNDGFMFSSLQLKLTETLIRR